MVCSEGPRWLSLVFKQDFDILTLTLLLYTAECCISLRNLIGPSPVCVQSELIHQGLSVGELE